MIPKNIKRRHILKVIREIDRNGVPESRKSRRFQLVYKGRDYPPKYVVSLANKHANGFELESSQFSGGQETNSSLRRLGFKIVELLRSGAAKPTSHQRKRHNERCPECKRTVEALLRQIYGEVKVNYRFETGTKPQDYKQTTYYHNLKEIFNELRNHRGHRNFVKAQILPHCDFFIPDPGFIVEFDESQHFTACRKLALFKYPETLGLGFDRDNGEVYELVHPVYAVQGVSYFNIFHFVRHRCGIQFHPGLVLKTCPLECTLQNSKRIRYRFSHKEP